MRELAETRACQERQLHAVPRDAESFGSPLQGRAWTRWLPRDVYTWGCAVTMSGHLPHGTRCARDTDGTSVHRVANQRQGDQLPRVSTGVDARSAESTARGGQRPKPRLRGVSHKYAAWTAAVAGLGLVVAAPTQRSRL